jgi:hypothetical protein
MSVTRYLILMTVATLLCLSALTLILYTVDPFTDSSLGLILFYLSLFFSGVGLLSLIGFLCRYFFNKNQFVTEQAVISFRQAILFSALLTIWLYLQSKNLITWWNLCLLVLILTTLEICWQALEKNKQHHINQ